MAPEQLLTTLEAKGVRVSEQDGRLAVSPPGVLSEDERNAIRAHKPALLALVRERAGQPLPDITRVSLWKLDKIVEFRVPWYDQTLYLAPGCRVARRLADQYGAARVRCVCRVLDFFAMGDASACQEAAAVFRGRVVGATTWAACADPQPKGDS
jgi:hypothetical protein